MIDFLQTELKENSILLILISAIIGGFVGATLKLVFEVILADRYNQNREAKAIINKYRNPIVSSADALRGRIANFLSESDQEWFSQSEYYRLSTLYVFCAYFAWVEILFGNLTRIRYLTSRQNRKLHRIVVSIDKSFNNREYFYPIDEYIPANNTCELPKFICKALGELTIDDCSNNEPSCLNFSDFCRKYYEDSEYREWICNLENFLSNIKKDYGNLKWDRMHIIQLSLIALTNFLDPQHELSRKYKSSITKMLLSRINYHNAREIFCMDVVKNQLPVVVEGKKAYFSRLLLIILRKSPRIYNPPRIPKINAHDLVIEFDATRCDLTTKKGRSEMYSQIKAEAFKRTAILPYGVTLEIQLDLGSKELEPEVLKRIPGNLASVTENRILASNVHIKNL